MTLNNPSGGAGSTAEYIVPGVPYLTASTLASGSTAGFAFPFVTRHVHIRNTGAAEIRVGVTAAGVLGTNWFSVPSGSSEMFEWRTRELYLRSAATTTYTMEAGLTGIDSKHFPVLTGSNGQSGVG